MKVTLPASYSRVLVMAVLLVVACSESTVLEQSAALVVGDPTIRIKPSRATVRVGATRQFVASVSDPAATVIWALSGPISDGGGGAVRVEPGMSSSMPSVVAGGIDANGLFTAPPDAGTYLVSATIDGTGISAEVQVEVPPVVVTPSVTSAVVTVGRRARFRASVTGALDRSVTWSTTGGSIVVDGNAVTFHAPAAPGPVQLTATSNANPAIQATIDVSVQAHAIINVNLTNCDAHVDANTAAYSPAGNDGEHLVPFEGGGWDCTQFASQAFSPNAGASHRGAIASSSADAAYGYVRTAPYSWSGSGAASGSTSSSVPAAIDSIEVDGIKYPDYHGALGWGRAQSSQTIKFTVLAGTARMLMEATFQGSCDNIPNGSSGFVNLIGPNGPTSWDVFCGPDTVSWNTQLGPGNYQWTVGVTAEGNADANSCFPDLPDSPCTGQPQSSSSASQASYSFTMRLVR